MNYPSKEIYTAAFRSPIANSVKVRFKGSAKFKTTKWNRSLFHVEVKSTIHHAGKLVKLGLFNFTIFAINFKCMGFLLI